MEVVEMAKEYLVEIFGCDDSTKLIIQADDIQFSVMKNLADRATEASANGCQPTMSVREATEADKRRLEDE